MRDRQESFGQVWADAMAFALKIEGREDVRLITDWEDPAPMSEREVLENLLLKKRLGLSTEQALLDGIWCRRCAEDGLATESTEDTENAELMVEGWWWRWFRNERRRISRKESLFALAVGNQHVEDDNRQRQKQLERIVVPQRHTKV